MKSANQIKIKTLEPLTSLRFFAALVVFIWHSQLFSSVLNKYYFGELGVGFFFLLSGFILTYVYYFGSKLNNNIDVFKFYIARIAKIYPIHLITFLISIPLVLSAYGIILSSPIEWSLVRNAFYNLMLIQSLFSDQLILYSYNNVSWSISAEIIFYIFFPLIMYIVNIFKNKLNKKNIIYVMLILWFIIALYNGFNSQNRIVNPIFRISEFTLGIMACLLFNKIGNIKKSLSTKLEIGAIVFLICSLLLYPYLSQDIMTVTAMIPAMLFLIIIFANQSGSISQILSNKVLIFLGNISFSFYMIHMLVLRYMNGIGNTKNACFAFVITILLSIFSYYVIEEPARKRIKFISDRHFAK